ncbi:hypothetical protein [Nocardioides sp. MH1]|uniref:hypothetical protein n=1 Tax=Nocardioides sp. MH1 TaxID=3242490 RepID=UPI00351FC8AE
MKRPFLLATVAAAVVVVVVVLVLVVASGDGDSDGSGADRTTTSSGPAVVSDDDWCAGWDRVVQTQGAYVADPTSTNADAVLAAVSALQDLGVPESLDPAGYTELGAVLDDVHGSVDPSFTPSIAPSEPADVESDNAAQAPFGAWLAQYCPR